MTLSRPGADRQAEALEAAGYQVLVAPVIDTEPTLAPIPTGRWDFVVFLSAHAVRYGYQTSFCRGATLVAVGESTAAALRERGAAAEVGEGASSDALLEYFDAMELPGVRVLIVAGEDGRKILRDELIGRTAEVREYLCYRRVRRSPALGETKRLDVVLVGSQDGFRQVARLWFAGGGRPEVKIIAASARIAALAPDLGFSDVSIASGAAINNWIAALDEMKGSC